MRSTSEVQIYFYTQRFEVRCTAVLGSWLPCRFIFILIFKRVAVAGIEPGTF